MTEEQLEHLIRASGAILRDDAVLVVGSQSMHEIEYLRAKYVIHRIAACVILAPDKSWRWTNRLSVASRLGVSLS